MSELAYKGEAASVYDRAFAHVSTHFLPFLLRAARLVPGQRVLDAAAGTGIAAQAALAVVGPGGHVTAADISLAMVNRARQRLAGSPNASVVVEDGQSLSFANASFDAVLCSLGLMFFPDPERGLSEFHRVLCPGGCAAVSVNTTPQRSYNGRINVSIARRVPALAEATARTFSLGDERHLRSLFERTGFRNVETTTEAHCSEQSKRWVVVSPPGARESRLLLARASSPEQESRVGAQTGGRVFLFLYTDDFWRDYERYKAKGVECVRPPKQEPYGTVAVFTDLYGNMWDLLQPNASSGGVA